MTSHAAPAIVLTLTVIAGLTSGCTKPLPAPPKPVAIAPMHAGEQGLRPVGAVALAPAGGGLITEAQVRDYVSAHRIPRLLADPKASVREVSFVSGQQVSARLHSAPLPVAADEPLCLVILDGHFVFPGPPGQTPTFPVGVEVFDAKTGRLLQFGGMPAKALERQPG
jgi:hypothetical protein